MRVALVFDMEGVAHIGDVREPYSEPAIPTSVFIRPNGQIFDFRLGAEPAGGTTDRFLADLP